MVVNRSSNLACVSRLGNHRIWVFNHLVIRDLKDQMQVSKFGGLQIF